MVLRRRELQHEVACLLQCRQPSNARVMTELGHEERNADAGGLQLLRQLELLGGHLDALVGGRGLRDAAAHLGTQALEVAFVAGLLEHGAERREEEGAGVSGVGN